MESPRAGVIALPDRTVVSRTLRRSEQAVAETATDAFLAEHPDWVIRYGDRARQIGIQDARFHVQFLTAAVEGNSRTAFRDYVQWAAGVLSARGIARVFLWERLNHMQQAAAQHLIEADRELIAGFIEFAMTPDAEAAAVATADGPLTLTRQLFVQAILGGERKAALTIAQEALRNGAAIQDLYADVFQDGLYAVGRLWETNAITVVQEHMATAVTQYVMAHVFGTIDSAATGFLGLETFTDTTDPAVFYLITRWSHRGAFHDWHHGPAHRESHTGMPKGLRLDPSYTQLVELDRLPSADVPTIATVAIDGPAAIGAYLAQTRAVHLVRSALDGEIQVINAAMATHLGLPTAARGLSLYDYLTRPDAELLQVIVRDCLAGQAPSPGPMHLNFCEPNGEPFTLSCAVTVYPDGYLILGELVHDDDLRLQRQLIELNEELAALARERQRLVIAEQRARHLAEANNRDKDEGLAVIAHELRQPLSTAMAALGVLKLNPARAGRAVRSLDRQVGYMATLVEDLLHASQVMRGAVSLQCEPADLRDLVREAAESIEAGVRERAQQLTVISPPAPLMVSVDVRRMRQVVTNILSNAMKYTPAGGAIVVSIEQIGEEACGVRVRDTGEGLAAGALARVFDLFVRGTTGGNGLGIGLAVAKRLAELHGGTIGATSEGVGSGADFLVTLPVLVHPPDAGAGGACPSSLIDNSVTVGEAS